MSASPIRAGGAFVEIFAKDGKFYQAMARMQLTMKRMATGMQNVGRQMATGAAMVGAPLVAAVAQFMTFDDAIRATGAVAQATEPELASLTKRARELGATTSFTATQVAQLMTELGRAGFKPAEIEAMTGAVLNLSRATGTDATLASGIMAATLRQFSLGAGDAARAADVLTAAANKSFNTVEGLGEALKYAGPVAKNAGMSLEETAAILGTLGNMGIQGSEAGTTLRRLLTITGAEAKKLKDLLGVSFLDAAGNVRPLVDTLGEVAEATASLASGEKLERFNEAFGLLGITGAQVIAGTVTDTRKLTQELYNAGGIAAKVAKMMDSGIGGSMRMLLSAIGEVSISLGEALAPGIMFVAAHLQALSGVIGEQIKKYPLLAQIVGGITGGVFALGIVAIFAGLAMKVLASGIGLVKNVMTLIPMLFTPVGLAIAGIAGGIALAVISARALSPTFRHETDGIMAALGKLDFQTAWEILEANVSISLTAVGQMFDKLWTSIKNGALDAATYMADKLKEGANKAVGWSGYKPFETLGEDGRQAVSDQRNEEYAARTRQRQADVEKQRARLNELHEKARAPAGEGEAGDFQKNLDDAMNAMREMTKMPIGPLGALGGAGESGMVGEGVKSATLSGYSSNVQGIGPQLDAAQQTAMATKDMAGKLASIDEGVKQAARIAEGQTAKTQVDRDMMSTSEKMLAEMKDIARGIKELIREARNGGVTFA